MSAVGFIAAIKDRGRGVVKRAPHLTGDAGAPTVAPMKVAEVIRRTLTDALSPERLEIMDDSHLHAGHAGARPEGETHFTVEIVSASFAGRSRVERQRLVYTALADLLRERIHALALRTFTPDEDRARRAG